MLHLGVDLIPVEERFEKDKNAGFNMNLVINKQPVALCMPPNCMWKPSLSEPVAQRSLRFFVAGTSTGALAATSSTWTRS